MESLQYMRVDESGRSDTYCNYCMIFLLGEEKAWVSKDEKYFCCRECAEQYAIAQLAY